MLESVWKLALKSLAGWSGGSSASWSRTPPASTRERALGVVGQVRGRVEREDGAVAGDAERDRGAVAREPERVGRGHGLGEGDADARALVDLGRAVGGIGRADRRRLVAGRRAVVAPALGVGRRAQREVRGVVVGVPRLRGALVGLVGVGRRGRERRALLVGRAGRLPDLVDDRETRGEDRDAAVVGDPRPVGLVARGGAGAVGQQVGAARAAASRRRGPSRASRPSRSPFEPLTR